MSSKIFNVEILLEFLILTTNVSDFSHILRKVAKYTIFQKLFWRYVWFVLILFLFGGGSVSLVNSYTSRNPCSGSRVVLSRWRWNSTLPMHTGINTALSYRCILQSTLWWMKYRSDWTIWTRKHYERKENDKKVNGHSLVSLVKVCTRRVEW